ncbi:MAG: NUDIX hydrolase [Candidatus Saccharimonadales bacterium]
MTRFIYCPECAGKLAPEEHGWPTCPEGHFTKYPTPVAATLALVRNDDQYLVIRRSHAPRKGYWDLPGGFVEPGESALDTLIREIREETGLEVEEAKLLGTYPSVYGETGSRTLATGYVFDSIGREVALSEENDKYMWCGLNDMPELAFEDCTQAVKDLQQLLVLQA